MVPPYFASLLEASNLPCSMVPPYFASLLEASNLACSMVPPYFASLPEVSNLTCSMVPPYFASLPDASNLTCSMEPPYFASLEGLLVPCIEPGKFRKIQIKIKSDFIYVGMLATGHHEATVKLTGTLRRIMHGGRTAYSAHSLSYQPLRPSAQGRRFVWNLTKGSKRTK